MGHYIDVEKLIAEIEKWRDKAKEKYNESTYSMGRCDSLAEFRNHIVSLLEEQPEVDLEKEFEDYLNNMEGQPRIWHSDEQIEWAKDIARHFWNKGYNARKED